jgi:hypothetical protein
VQNEVYNQAMAGTLLPVQTTGALRRNELTHIACVPQFVSETNALRGAAIIEDYDFRKFEVRTPRTSSLVLAQPLTQGLAAPLRAHST